MCASRDRLTLQWFLAAAGVIATFAPLLRPWVNGGRWPTGHERELLVLDDLENFGEESRVTKGIIRSTITPTPCCLFKRPTQCSATSRRGNADILVVVHLRSKHPGTDKSHRHSCIHTHAHTYSNFIPRHPPVPPTPVKGVREPVANILKLIIVSFFGNPTIA